MALHQIIDESLARKAQGRKKETIKEKKSERAKVKDSNLENLIYYHPRSGFRDAGRDFLPLSRCNVIGKKNREESQHDSLFHISSLKKINKKALSGV